ncbi:probable protease inhibitor BBRPI [Streptomyces sp. NBRC 110611]|nr:probable protease inhibitor BBRPI [Streptomyces sp. NBRC 110611]
MRQISRGITVGIALALAALTSTATVANAVSTQQRSLFGPSELVLTVGYGARAGTAAIQRAVSLSCTSRPAGTHPDPRRACASMRATKGNLHEVTKAVPKRVCAREWNPRVVTAEGVWQGRRVVFERTYANPCEMASAANPVFAF